jgi:hypothetical protein
MYLLFYEHYCTKIFGRHLPTLLHYRMSKPDVFVCEIEVQLFIHYTVQYHKHISL